MKPSLSRALQRIGVASVSKLCSERKFPRSSGFPVGAVSKRRGTCIARRTKRVEEFRAMYSNGEGEEDSSLISWSIGLDYDELIDML